MRAVTWYTYQARFPFGHAILNLQLFCKILHFDKEIQCSIWAGATAMMGCWSTGSLSKRLQNTLRAWRRKKSIARRRRQDTQETRPHSPTCHICHAGGWFCHAEDGPGRLPEVGGSEASRRCFSWSKRSRQGCSWSGGYWVTFQLHSLYTSVAASIYIYRSINLILKMIAFGFFFTRVSELHQNMLSGPCAATSCLEALHWQPSE